jgi:DNA (cytosine-5)-methyltransferase 1
LKTDLAHQSGPCLAVAPIGCFKSGQGAKSRSIGYSETVSPTLPSNAGGNTAPSLVQTMQVRRLTPTECERLQGFPDGWTAIPWKKKNAEDCPDGPRYKALGNSMAVNCMEWLGERIQKFDQSSLCQLP